MSDDFPNDNDENQYGIITGGNSESSIDETPPAAKIPRSSSLITVRRLFSTLDNQGLELIFQKIIKDPKFL